MEEDIKKVDKSLEQFNIVSENLHPLSLYYKDTSGFSPVKNLITSRNYYLTGPGVDRLVFHTALEEEPSKFNLDFSMDIHIEKMIELFRLKTGTTINVTLLSSSGKYLWNEISTVNR